MRLPSKRLIQDKIINSGTKKSIEYLIKNRTVLSKYRDIEDFILRDEEWATQTDEDPKILQGCEYHLSKVRNRFAKELWSRDFYLGISVLDDLLFSSFARSETNEPLIEALDTIRDSGVLRPGLVIYPLHSLGVLGAGLVYSYTSSKIAFFLNNYGLAFTPQTNSMAATTEFLESVVSALGVRKTLPHDLLDHWRRSRSLKWLERNPLLVLKVHSFPGSYYENQFFLVCKLKAATALACMLYALQPYSKEHGGAFFSSSRTNNWETLDIKHYLLLYPKPYRRILTGDCIPMNAGQAALAELSEVPVQIDPKFWQRRIPLSGQITDALTKTVTGFASHHLSSNKKAPIGRVYRKLFRSLEFYKKSFRQREDIGESAVLLAVAFELLLTDNYAPGVTNRIVDRMSLLLKGVPGIKSFKKAVEALYSVRSMYVHSGFIDDSLDLKTSRVAFIHAFLTLSNRLTAIPHRTEEPIRYLIEK